MSDDSELQQAVLAELAWEPGVDAAHIGVTAKAGVVTLSGHVDNYAGKLAAEAAAGRVRGVKAVAEELDVRLPFDSERSDEDIAEAALSRLAWDSTVPRGSVSVRVEGGWVTLSGELDAQHQRAAAEADVRGLLGVIGVSNQTSIKVGTAVDLTNLSDDITHALHRSWFFDPKLIRVTGEGGHIRLTGSVHYLRDRNIAAATAWAAAGVTAVQNDITVG
jgi:osmotically-inducible protein OsmY